MKTIAKWSVEDYHQMINAGILNERRVELLAGEIIEMSPETPIHYNTAKRGSKYLEELLVGKAEVRFNGLITLLNSEPEPDIAIVRLPESRYDARHPRAKDIFWLIEVANTSQKKDLGLKKELYAIAQIQEYWVWDLIARNMTVFRGPSKSSYLVQQEITQGEITPLAFPDIKVSVERLFRM
ncbi:MAG: Uma2 family endonuclease [Symploca sp. SIO1B1]|nr:Uma2 family endonuclease [Symploca sp. SIO1B1]